jgi:hypothetical protein|nr:MAG TPA: hypothetical protein [Caudoviricetes sp.]
MIFNVLAMFMCGLFFVALVGSIIACTIALVKSVLEKPRLWGDSFVLCGVLFMSILALVGDYSIITMIGTPA